MIGETVYLFDGNQRVYKNDDGTPSSTPNPRRYWRATEIVNQTRDSWVLKYEGMKVDKKTMRLRLRDYFALDPRVYTQAQMEDKLWSDMHRGEILRLVQDADVTTLRRVAAALANADQPGAETPGGGR
jgi:hypothetical protein